MRIKTMFFELGLASMLIPGTSYAQAALQDCLTDFDTAIQAFINETNGGTRDEISCNEYRGLVQIFALGTVASEDYKRTFLALLQKPNSQGRICKIDLAREETDNLEYTHSISAKDAAAWNRFLIGPGCQQLKALFP